MVKEADRKPYFGEVTTFRCNDCEAPVHVSSERPLTEKQTAELAARMLCTPCLNKKVGKK
jgi:hypothetical protein